MRDPGCSTEANADVADGQRTCGTLQVKSQDKEVDMPGAFQHKVPNIQVSEDGRSAEGAVRRRCGRRQHVHGKPEHHGRSGTENGGGTRRGNPHCHVEAGFKHPGCPPDCRRSA